MRAGIYARISRDRRVDGTLTMLGVERQEEDCRELCATLGWEVAELYVDNDKSATTGKPRPAYKAMLAAVEAGAIDAIVCWHPDRLYRRTVDLEELVSVCDRYRVPIATVNAGAVDLTTPTGRLVAGLLAQVAKYEGEHKAERWRRGYRQRREAGTPPPSGPRMFGWTREGEVIPEEAEAIKATAKHLLNGGSVRQACTFLNEAGFTTTYGNPWRHAALTGLMRNPRLAGWVRLKGELVCRSTWPAILDDETFASVGALFTGRPRRRGYPRVAVLLGIAVCGVCGSNLITGRRNEGAKPRVYRCPPPPAGNGCVSVLAEPVEAVVEGYAERRLEDPRVREALARSLTVGAGTKIAEEIGALEARLVALNHALTDVDRPVPEVLRAIAEVRERIDDATERLAKVGPVAVPTANQAWPTDVARRRAFTALVVDRVLVAKSTGVTGEFNPDRLTIVPKGEEVAHVHVDQ